MIIDFLEVFPSKDSCINLISEKHIFVYEDSTLKKGIFVKANEVHHIHIQNDIDDDCFFVQNDDCVMISEKGGQCDCDPAYSRQGRPRQDSAGDTKAG